MADEPRASDPDAHLVARAAADEASGELSDGELDSVGGGAGLLDAISAATGVYQKWMTTLKSAADSKGQTQSELAQLR